MSELSRLRPTPGLVQALARSSGLRLQQSLTGGEVDGLKPIHALMLVPLLTGGRRASDLAPMLGVSRQAIAQAAEVLEEGGFVERIADPADARAKIILLTAKGRAGVSALRAGGADLEREWEEHIGAERLAEFRTTLVALISMRAEEPGHRGGERRSGEAPP